MRKIEIPRWCGIAAVCCGIVLMIIGIGRGEADVVLKKAINICLECIGIG